MSRKLFEKKEGFCDNCNRELTTKKSHTNPDKKIALRYCINELIVCSRCERRYSKNGDFEYRRLVNPTEEERQESLKKSLKKYHDKRNAIKRQAREYIRNMPPEELIKKVMSTDYDK